MAMKQNLKELLENGVFHEKGTEEAVSSSETPGKKRVKIKNLICRPEGTFLAGSVYELNTKLADLLIKNGNAEESK